MRAPKKSPHKNRGETRGLLIPPSRSFPFGCGSGLKSWLFAFLAPGGWFDSMFKREGNRKRMGYFIFVLFLVDGCISSYRLLKGCCDPLNLQDSRRFMWLQVFREETMLNKSADKHNMSTFFLIISLTFFWNICCFYFGSATPLPVTVAIFGS